jgi:hypothetical protein
MLHRLHHLLYREVLYNTRDVRRRRALVQDALAVSLGERVLDVVCR